LNLKQHMGKTLHIEYKIRLTGKTKTITGKLISIDHHNILLRYNTKQGKTVEVWYKKPRSYDTVTVLDYTIFDIKKEENIK